MEFNLKLSPSIGDTLTRTVGEEYVYIFNNLLFKLESLKSLGLFTLYSDNEFDVSNNLEENLIELFNNLDDYLDSIAEQQIKIFILNYCKSILDTKFGIKLNTMYYPLAVEAINGIWLLVNTKDDGLKLDPEYEYSDKEAIDVIADTLSYYTNISYIEWFENIDYVDPNFINLMLSIKYTKIEDNKTDIDYLKIINFNDNFKDIELVNFIIDLVESDMLNKSLKDIYNHIYSTINKKDFKTTDEYVNFIVNRIYTVMILKNILLVDDFISGFDFNKLVILNSIENYKLLINKIIEGVSDRLEEWSEHD